MNDINKDSALRKCLIWLGIPNDFVNVRFSTQAQKCDFFWKFWILFEQFWIFVLEQKIQKIKKNNKNWKGKSDHNEVIFWVCNKNIVYQVQLSKKPPKYGVFTMQIKNVTGGWVHLGTGTGPKNELCWIENLTNILVFYDESLN